MECLHHMDDHGFPIVTFIDIRGAFADLKSKELGQFPPLVSLDVDAGNEPPANRKHGGTVSELIEFSSSSRKHRRPIQQNDMGSQRFPVSNAQNVRGRVGADCVGDVMDTFSLTQQVSSAAITQSTSDAFETDPKCIFPSGTIAKLIESSSSSGHGRMQIRAESQKTMDFIRGLRCTECKQVFLKEINVALPLMRSDVEEAQIVLVSSRLRRLNGRINAKRAQRWFNHVPQTNENAVEWGIVTCFSLKLPKADSFAFHRHIFLQRSTPLAYHKHKMEADTKNEWAQKMEIWKKTLTHVLQGQ
ncbi:hypothetical protein Tco_0624241 [Tanacetum coccineum]|uniref:Uncharacterized protein n=1 Tax=Tanacetum coccineum TaxID=301880 RepID=A0ABQ4WDI8_9ASTR